ncbi:hypothetical protein [Oscillibacter sp. MSJ-31]|uniref:hypothetical protein n=1 Tax=Oscillibacter sp. MSJ-31 TaxID=2841526 RepID=UPI001C10971A|nr:hypothetical protein [Oscillibacter sp. MSJ-31]MBU5458737.1 hypothetical protein [Oscillibacter sp. MSJ-31]
MSGLFIGGIQNKVPIDGVHVPIERRPVIIRLDSGKIYLDELRQNGRGFFLVDKADALSKGWNEIRIGRSSVVPGVRVGAAGTSHAGAANAGGERRPSSTRKLICPCCGNSVRATKSVRIMCMDCMQQMNEV